MGVNTDMATLSIDFGFTYPDRADLVNWVYEIAKYLNNNPIVTPENVAEIIEQWLSEHPIPQSVESVNGQTGKVKLTYSDVNALPDTYQPPVTSVNGEVGDVNLDASNIGALPSDYEPPVRTVNNEIGNILVSKLIKGDVQIGIRSEIEYPGLDIRSGGNYVGAIRINKNVDNDGFYRIEQVDKAGRSTATIYTSKDPPPNLVTSVNGDTGAVNVSVDASIVWKSATMQAGGNGVSTSATFNVPDGYFPIYWDTDLSDNLKVGTYTTWFSVSSKTFKVSCRTTETGTSILQQTIYAAFIKASYGPKP